MSHATVRKIAATILILLEAALIYAMWLLFHLFWKDYLVLAVTIVCSLLFFLQSHGYFSAVLEKTIIWIMKKDKKNKGKNKGKKTEHHKSSKKKDKSSSTSNFSG